MKKLTLLFGLLVNSLFFFSQTSSIADGLWSDPANWSNGVPTDDEVVTVSNDMILDENITIDDGGAYTITGSVVDPIGGGAQKITVKGTGSLVIDGKVSVEGDIKVEDFGDFLLKGCDTLNAGKNIEFKETATAEIEDCAVFTVAQDFKIKDDVAFVVDGNLFVDGDLKVEDDVVISGNGNIETLGTTTINNNATVFGTDIECNPGPCEYGSGQGLPIVLKDFSATFINESSLEVWWSTLSEINNDYFSVSYSYDGEEFFESTTVRGAGTSYSLKEYKVIIENIESKLVYLKLKQTDYDGQFEEFRPIVARQLNTTVIGDKNKIIIYPNPSRGESVNMQLLNFDEGIYTTLLRDHSGKVISESTIAIENGNHRINFNLSNGASLEKGIYVVQIISSKTVLSEKLIIQ